MNKYQSGAVPMGCFYTVSPRYGSIPCLLFTRLLWYMRPLHDGPMGISFRFGANVISRQWQWEPFKAGSYFTSYYTHTHRHTSRPSPFCSILCSTIDKWNWAGPVRRWKREFNYQINLKTFNYEVSDFSSPFVSLISMAGFHIDGLVVRYPFVWLSDGAVVAIEEIVYVERVFALFWTLGYCTALLKK